MFVSVLRNCTYVVGQEPSLHGYQPWTGNQTLQWDARLSVLAVLHAHDFHLVDVISLFLFQDTQFFFELLNPLR